MPAYTTQPTIEQCAPEHQFFLLILAIYINLLKPPPFIKLQKKNFIGGITVFFVYARMRSPPHKASWNSHITHPRRLWGYVEDTESLGGQLQGTGRDIGHPDDITNMMVGLSMWQHSMGCSWTVLHLLGE